MSDVLKKPVHIALLKPTHIQNLAKTGKITASQFGMDPDQSTPELPGPPKVSNIPKFEKPAMAHSSLMKQSQRQIRLRVLHDRIPPPDPAPPCSSCKASPCCKAFVVNITEEEYESGFYGDTAVKLTPEIYQQLQSRFIAVSMLGAPQAPHNSKEPSYFLDGKMGDACPFLLENNRCGIYDVRPVTCRTYSCVSDSRITESMRDGSEEIDMLTLKATNAK